MPKQVIDLSRGARNLTFMLYGDSRTGKTRFLATFPKPLIIADASERGYETIVWMKRSAPELFYDPAIVPEVWAVSNAVEMAQACAEAEATLQADPTRWRTVGFDSLTFIADSYLAMIMANQGDKFDSRRAYGELAQKLSFLMTKANNLPAHVVWTALAKNPDVDDKGQSTGSAGLLLAGQTADKAPARCNYWFYFTAFGNGQFQVRTRKYGRYPAGGRDMGALADPLPEVSYRSVEEGLGIEPFVAKKIINQPAARFVAGAKTVNK